MTFNTFTFYLFFTAIVIVNYILPRRWRWVWLLISSYVFYSFSDIKYLVVLIICTGISYLTGRMIEKNKDNKLKKTWMLVGVILNVGILILFRYINFFFNSPLHSTLYFRIQAVDSNEHKSDFTSIYKAEFK